MASDSTAALSAAQQYLQRLPARFLRRGREYFAAGAVRALEPQGGYRYLASVQGSHRYSVQLDYDPDAGWRVDCTCPLRFDCKHAAAALLALLQQAGAEVPGGPPPVGLVQALEAKLGRVLSGPELARVLGLRNLYQRFGTYSALYISQLREVFPKLTGTSWDQIAIGAVQASNELEWWSFVATALLDRGENLPGFLLTVVDQQRVRQIVLERKRQQEIERWQGFLQHYKTATGPVPAAGAVRTLAVRLRVADFKIELETRDLGGGPDAEYRKLKASAFRALALDYEEGRAQVSPESLALWLSFYQRWQITGSVGCEIGNQETRRVLGGLLRQPLTRPLVVGPDGAPLRWVEPPLRWQVDAGINPHGDYRLRLVQADGTDAPKAWCILAGQPTLYLSENAVQPGPPQIRGVFSGSWNQPVFELDNATVPAPVLESTAGIRLLQHLGAELPPSLQAKIQKVSLRLAMDALLDRSGGQEWVLVSITATGAGHEEYYTADGWIEDVVAEPALCVFDRGALECVPRLVQDSDLKWHFATQTWRWRVTRNFPGRFAAWLASLPPEIELLLDPDLATLQDAPLRGKIRLDVQSTALDWFDLQVVLDVADTKLTKEELRALLDARGGFVRVGTAGWRRLQFDLTAEEDAQLAQLGLSPSDFSSEPQRLHALQLADKAASRLLPAAQVAAIQRRAAEIQTRVNPPLPATVQAQLRPYQLEGYHFLAYLSSNRFGGVLADDMGLGKTLQTLAWLAWLRDQAGPASSCKPALVVCPKSVMDNWRVEASRFLPGLRLRLWSGTETEPVTELLDQTDLLVVNYTQLRLLSDQLNAIGWLAVILDEGQYIKNPQSQTAKVACSLRADHRLVLTGTPIENRLMDLWSLMSFAMPGLLGSRVRFARQFDNATDALARQRLAARVRPFLLRRTKAQVAPELPERIEEDLFCEMEPEQRTVYRAELKQAQQQLLKLKTAKDLDRERFSILTSLLRLRQICCHPGLVSAKAQELPSAKIDALLELLEPLMDEGHKVLVFSQFVGLIQLLEPLLRQRQWPQFVLTGATENRGALVADFQKASGAAVFLISLKAGGFGLNLTAANYVVLFDPWWNPAVENQAIDRTHRIGQTRHVNAYRLLIKDTVEEKIRHLQKTKSALAADVLGEERFAQSLTLDDLKFLLAEG